LRPQAAKIAAAGGGFAEGEPYAPRASGFVPVTREGQRLIINSDLKIIVKGKYTLEIRKFVEKL